MLFVTKTVETEDLNKINNFFTQFENEFEAVKTVEEENAVVSNVVIYNSSLATNNYKKSIEDIANTKVASKLTRKRNLQQVMQESFFYGANRFGNNFIA